MKHNIVLLSLVLYSQCISAHAQGSFSIECGYNFTGDGISFCIGIPVECTVSLDTDSCIAGVDMFTESDLAVIITDSSYGNFYPYFYSTQNNSLITITIDYVPEYYPSTITVNVMGSLTSNCTFDVTHMDNTTILCIITLTPWIILYSDVEATETEFPAYPSYVTIGERFSMAIVVFIPEGVLTDLHLFVILPSESYIHTPLVTLNDAYVKYIGADVLNTTLQEGDNITTGNNITLTDNGRVVDFFFGYQIFVPATLYAINQSVKVGVDCTVRNLPSLVDGVSITFKAYAETGDGIATYVEIISLQIAEPYLDFTQMDPIGPFYAGDVVSLEVVTDSSTQQTSAFRFNFTFIYLTEILYLNDSDPSLVFSVNNIPLANFTPNATFNDSMGIIPYSLTEKGVNDSVRTLLRLVLTNSALLASEYTVSFTADWHSLPPGYEGGRSYSDSGEIRFFIGDLSITSRVDDSSSTFTGGNALAVNEVFQILLEIPIPSGERDFRVVAMIQTLQTVEVPVDILDTEETIPPPVSTSVVDISITEAPCVLEISWDFGTVVNPLNGSLVTIGLTYTAVVLDTQVSNVTIQFLAVSFTDGVVLSTSTLTSAMLVMPVLTVSQTAMVVPGSDPLLVQVTGILSHDISSTSPAFSVKIQEMVPEILKVSLPYRLEVDGIPRLLNGGLRRNNLTVLSVEIGVVPLQAEVNLTYFALLSPDHQSDGTFIAPIVVSYMTVRQEGIGLLYNTFVDRSLNTIICFTKTVIPSVVEVKKIEYIVIPLLCGLLFPAIILLIVMTRYHCIKRNRHKNTKIAPAALVAAVIGRNKKEDEEFLIFNSKKRPLFSSLLDALPKKTWNVRDDVYECREADYIAEVEGNLLYAKSQMIIHLFKYFLQSKTALSKDDITKNTDVFKLKVNILQKTLQESVRSDLENLALQYGADKILRGEEQDSKHNDRDTNMREAIPTNLSASEEVLHNLQEQNLSEKFDALDLIDVTSKREKIRIIRHHTNHYLLGLKAIVSNILQEASVSDSDEIISELYDALEYGERLIQGETNELIEMADIRGKRQKTILLDEKLVEEADERWRILLLDHIDRSVTELVRLEVISGENRDVVKNELEEVLMKEFYQQVSDKLQDEIKLNNMAKAELKDIEQQLLKPSQIQYYSDDKEMLKKEFERWHNKQAEKEQALKQVEDKIYSTLTKDWGNWLKRRDKIVMNFTANLTTQLLTRGLEPEQCHSTMQEHAKSRQELSRVIETSKLVQRAKFRARLNYFQERLLTLTQQSESLFKRKLEVERKHLEKAKESIGNMNHDESSVFEEYLDDIKNLERSLSVEKLSIHINLKEKVALRRKNKFEMLFRQFLETREQEEQKEEKDVKTFLDKRRDAVFEMCTRSYEEERKKAEEEFAQEKEKILNVPLKNYAETHTQVQTGPSKKVPTLSEPAEIQDETKMLLNSHQEDLVKLTNKLEDERKKAMLALEQKMKQRRVQREKAVAQLIQPDWSQFRRSKFKELIQKQILSTRVEKIRKQNMESMSHAMAALQEEYEGKKQEAKEKLEKKLETHLIESGKASSEKLVEIFEEMHYTGLDSFTSDSIDPLLVNRPKQGELPPIRQK